jgi:hypothetical protein
VVASIVMWLSSSMIEVVDADDTDDAKNDIDEDDDEDDDEL